MPGSKHRAGTRSKTALYEFRVFFGGLGLGFGLSGLGFRVEGLGLRIWGFAFRAFRVSG